MLTRPGAIGRWNFLPRQHTVGDSEWPVTPFSSPLYSLCDWRIGILYALVPLLCIDFLTAMTAWVQHAFYDTERPDNYFGNTVTVYDDVNFMNEGYHLSHHHRSSRHWTEMPAHHARLREQMRESGSLVFRDLDFIGLFVELTVLRHMDVLADKLVPWSR